MPFKAAKCPNCAGDIQVPDERDTAKCMYCGSDIIVREAIKLAVPEINLDNIFRLADEAAAAGNNAEAYKYYTKILETDPENSMAWYGKAISAGWQSTLANLRLPETISGIENALKYAPEFGKETLKSLASLQLGLLALAIYSKVDEKHTGYLPTMRSIITVLEIAASYTPDDKSMLEIIVVRLQDLLKYPFLSDHNEMVNKMQEVEKKIQQLDPTYVPEYRATEEQPPAAPPITNKTSCFIATAAYGSAVEPEVVILRKFRDSYLNRTPLGNAFIAVYYNISPSIAVLISRSKGLKAMTRFLLKPLIYLIKRSG